MKNYQGLSLSKPSLGITLSRFAGVSLAGLILTGPVDAQQSQNSPNRRPGRESIVYELKGDELRICRPASNPSKEKECTAIGKGYTFSLRTANDLYGQGNIANAEALFRQLIARYPKQAETYYKLGSVLSSQGKVSDAIAQYREAISRNAQHAKARNDLAVALASQDQLDEAITEWREALKINADYADALNNLGVALLQQGQAEKREEAVTNLQKARDLFRKQGRMQAAERIDRILQEIGSQVSSS